MIVRLKDEKVHSEKNEWMSCASNKQPVVFIEIRCKVLVKHEINNSFALLLELIKIIYVF